MGILHTEQEEKVLQAAMREAAKLSLHGRQGCPRRRSVKASPVWAKKAGNRGAGRAWASLEDKRP